MFKFVILSALAIVVSAQHNGYHQNPKTAAIISEQRYLSGDGKFGAAYTQEDGTDFKEETDADGTRHGSYSYIDPTGQKKTVSYTAGKNGFQATGDHLPVAPVAPPQQAPQPQYQPQQQYHQQPQSHYQPQQQQRGDNDYDDGSYDARYNDPSFSTGGHHVAQPAPQPQQQPQYHQQQHQAPQQHQQQQHQSNYNQYNNQGNFEHHTTQNPHRFQPPGKLQLNRTPDGFSYSFNKV